MASTAAELCNLALLRVGQRQFIDSLEDTSAQAQVCALVYPHARNVVLEAAWWRFTTRRATLALLDLDYSDWEYAYALPSDCVTARYLWSGVRDPALEERIPFALEDDATSGRILLTDLEDAELIYGYQHETVARYPASFCDALVARVAVELAFSVPVKPNLAMGLDGAYRAALARAIASDRNQAQPDAPRDGELVRARS